ncbi:MAG TPA: dienelactone hydrolase family protein [Steroidobacteraceae bacterium]|nr:dienelactone hydrolase family protein [Steroidobacteraceae bacterium]
MCTFDECGRAARRSFLTRSLAVAAAALIGARARAAQRHIEGDEVTFPSSVGPVRGYVAKPSRRGIHPGVVLLHGEFGLPQTHRETADELAHAGFVALAVQRFSRVPGMTWQDLQADDRGAGRFRAGAFAREELDESRGAVDWLGASADVDADRLGAVGFCGGGIRAIRLAGEDPRVRGVVAFYPPPRIPPEYKNRDDPAPDLLELPTVAKCPLQIHFGTDDYIVKREDVDAFASLYRASGTRADAFEYAGAGHAFYDRTDASAYRASAASAARRRYLQFLRKSIGR